MGDSGNHRSYPNSSNREPSSTQCAKILAERKRRTSSGKGWIIRWSKRCASEGAGKQNPASIACEPDCCLAAADLRAHRASDHRGVQVIGVTGPDRRERLLDFLLCQT